MARLLRKLSCTNRGQQNMGESRRIPKMKNEIITIRRTHLDAALCLCATVVVHRMRCTTEARGIHTDDSVYGEIYSSICNKFFDVMDSVIDDPLSAEELTKISSESHK
jgi:hypothetical protein